MEYSLFKVDENEYLLSVVGGSQKLIEDIEEVHEDIDKAWIKHQVSSSSGYAVYEAYGANVDKLVEELKKILTKNSNES